MHALVLIEPCQGSSRGSPRPLCEWAISTSSLPGFHLLSEADSGGAVTRRLTPLVQARSFFDECLPGLSPYLREDDLSRFAARPISRLPSFQLVEGDIHTVTDEGGVVLLGDAIKTVRSLSGVHRRRRNSLAGQDPSHLSGSHAAQGSYGMHELISGYTFVVGRRIRPTLSVQLDIAPCR